MNPDLISRWWRTSPSKYEFIQKRFFLVKYNVSNGKYEFIAYQPIFFRISRFHEALIKYGVDKVDIFQTNDLAEKRDMGSVTNTMFALGRAVSVTLY